MKRIGISASLGSSGLRRMFNTLGEVLDVCFEERAFGDDAGIDAWILPEADQETLRLIKNSEQPCYAVIRREERIPCGETPAIDFSSDPMLPAVLTGRQIKADEAVKLMALPQQIDKMMVLASKEGAPVWAMQEIAGQHHHYVALPIPELNEEEPLFQRFNGKQSLSLIPLFVFLRTLTEDRLWEQPPLQACFMFDDPNLHWRTYGFIDFAQMAAHAQMHNYHVSFATIPQDRWFVHKPTALLFQTHGDQLSLLIHGNDHIAKELARPYSNEERNMTLQQALRRISAFERRSGVEVSRVMAPPHGACSESTLAEMARLGFEAACVSKGSLRHYNGKAPWLRTLGMKPSDIIGGLPVFPRFPLSERCHNSILIAALLNQPIIPVGHHHDVADGLRLLADVSGFVNSLGTVRWSDMKRISRSHFARKMAGKIFRIRMFTKRIEVCVPEEVNQILVERPWLKGVESIPFAWRLLSKGSEWKLSHSNEPINVMPDQKIEIVSELPTSAFIDAKKDGMLHLWPVVRRQFTEVRDRLAPLVRRVSTLSVNRKKCKQ